MEASLQTDTIAVLLSTRVEAFISVKATLAYVCGTLPEPSIVRIMDSVITRAVPQ